MSLTNASRNITLDNDFSFNSDAELKISLPTTAFSEVLCAQPSYVFQGKFLYDKIHPLLYNQTVTGSANMSVTNSICSLNISSANDSAQLESKRSIHYRNGQGSALRFTALYNAGSNGLTQMVGMGTISNGLYIGYQNNQFGIFHVNGGSPEIRSLTVTTGATATGNITITLNGTAFTVPVTNSSALPSFTAHQIEAVAMSGWIVEHINNVIYFISLDANPKNGTFSFAAGTSGTVATFAQLKAGVTPTTTFVASSSFSEDKLDGTGDSKLVVDPQKGNVYQIKMQWLGFGQISFQIENKSTGKFATFHRIKYTNTNTVLSLTNPHLYYRALISSSQATAASLKVASIGMFVEGTIERIDPKYSFSNLKTIAANTETVIVRFENTYIYNNNSNYSECYFLAFQGSSFGGRTVRINVYKNADAGNNTTANYTNPNQVTNDSLMKYDITPSTTITGGTLMFSWQLSVNDSKFIDVSKYNYYLARNESITITAFSTSTSDVSIGAMWAEEF